MKEKIVKETNWGVFLLLLCALFLLVNWLGYRHYHRWDVTKNKSFSLSEQSLKVVKGLDKRLDIVVFLPPGNALYQRVKDLLDTYGTASSKVHVKYVDPDRDPARVQTLAKKYGVTAANVVVFDIGGHSKLVENDQMVEYDFSGMRMGGAPKVKSFKAEEAFTNAILDLLDPRKPVIYFSTGHGERINAQRGMGIKTLKNRLKKEGAEVKEWHSLGSTGVPEDADLVIVAGPDKPFLEPEVELLRKYLAGGGKAFFMLDPVLLQGKPMKFGTTGLAPLLEEWGVKPLQDIILDPAASVSELGAQTFLSVSFGTNPIVNDLNQNRYPVLFSLARSLEALKPADKDYKVDSLIRSSSKSWGLRSLKNIGGEARQGKDDPKGPLSVAVAVYSGTDGKDTRIVVTGDSDVGSDALLGNGAGNLLFCMNSIHWLLHRENRIAIPPKSSLGSHLTITARQSHNLFILLVLILPFIVTAIGVYVYFQRRR